MKHQIQSIANPKVKHLLAKREDYFVFEGRKLASDIISRGGVIDKLIVLAGEEDKINVSPENIKEIWYVGSRVLKKLSTLKSPATHILYIKITHHPKIIATCQTILILDNIQDPGNVGSIFRCAAAFGIEAIALTGHSVKPNNSKLIRTAQHSLLDVPFFHFQSLEQCIMALPAKTKVYLTSPGSRGGESIPLKTLKKPLALVFGNEGSGLDVDLFKSFPTVTIPHSEKIDSLNVSISACILMYLITQK